MMALTLLIVCFKQVHVWQVNTINCRKYFTESSSLFLAFVVLSFQFTYFGIEFNIFTFYQYLDQHNF